MKDPNCKLYPVCNVAPVPIVGFYDHVHLTEDEVKAAIYEGKKKKYFAEKHANYWKEQEAKK